MKHWRTKCIDTSVLTPLQCKQRSGRWIYPTLGKAACESPRCYEPLPDKTYGLIYAWGWSDKPTNTCLGLGSSQKQPAIFSKGIWNTPIYRSNVTWTAHAMVNIDEMDTRILFNSKFYKTVVDKSLGANIGSTTSSAALCDFSSTRAVLESVTCDCYGGNGDCFNNNLLVPLSVCKCPC